MFVRSLNFAFALREILVRFFVRPPAFAVSIGFASLNALSEIAQVKTPERKFLIRM